MSNREHGLVNVKVDRSKFVSRPDTIGIPYSKFLIRTKLQVEAQYFGNAHRAQSSSRACKFDQVCPSTAKDQRWARAFRYNNPRSWHLQWASR
jgi:hypothetical protein